MRRLAALAALALAAACGPEPDRGLLYIHAEAREPFFRLDRAAGRWLPARPGAEGEGFPAVKAPGAFRVFVLGGSIAAIYRGPGDLSDALPPLLPGRAVEVVNCGMAGYDSAREERVLAEVLGHGADAVVLLTGHNESTGLVPPLPAWRLKLGLWAVEKGWVRRPTGSEGSSPAEVQARLRDFERSLRRMAAAAREAGAALVLVRPPLNLRDGSPRVFLPRTLDFREGWTRRLRGDCAGAREAWARPGAAGAPGEQAALAFLSARCLEREGRPAQARAAYLEAERKDPPLHGRCAGACADLLGRVAREEGALFADAHAVFLQRSAPGLPGVDSFHDRVHWRPKRHGWVSAAVAGALARAGLVAAGEPRLPPPEPEGRDEAWLPVLRYGASDAQTAAPSASLTALALLEPALKAWPRAPREAGALLARLAESDEDQGKAWGMTGLGQALRPFARHLALARAFAGDAAGARRDWAAAGPPQTWEDALDRLAVGGRPEAEKGLAALWERGESAPDLQRDDGIVAAAKALGLPTAGFARASARAHAPADPDARWTAAVSAGRLEAEARRDPSAARAAAERLLAGGGARAGLAELLFAALGDAPGARRAACRSGAGPEGELSCARRLAAEGVKDQAAARARRALASAAHARRAALLLQDLGDARSAAEALERLSLAAPGDASLACDAGTALYLAGDKARAAAAFTRARAADAASACAASGLAALGR